MIDLPLPPTEVPLEKTEIRTEFIPIKMGEIAVHVNPGPESAVPLVMLHGVYYDHHLWDSVVAKIAGRTVIRLDMPGHGESQRGVPSNWTLDDCATMLLEVLDALDLGQVIGIGHSWGSMTLLRAAHRAPERFVALGFCNMPFEAGTRGTQWQFRMQHTLLPFRGFYEKQVAKAMYGKVHRLTRPELSWQLTQSMRKVSNAHVRQTDQAVIMYVETGTPLIESLTVPALALKGEEDYVPVPPRLDTTIVPGGHVSPMEEPEQVAQWVKKVMGLSRG
ncbi:MAG TPA: hypothetical protein DCR93_34545 [Cytophagales bacterium]|nr:hypothetical protein [Cytophagales bacterium]